MKELNTCCCCARFVRFIQHVWGLSTDVLEVRSQAVLLSCSSSIQSRGFSLRGLEFFMQEKCRSSAASFNVTPAVLSALCFTLQCYWIFQERRPSCAAERSGAPVKTPGLSNNEFVAPSARSLCTGCFSAKTRSLLALRLHFVVLNLPLVSTVRPLVCQG